MNNLRVEEIRNQVYQPSEKVSGNEELLQEMQKLQDSIISVGYGSDLESYENMRIFDLERYLEERNAEKNHSADLELEKFEADCKDFWTTYRGIDSGIKGELKAFQHLDRITVDNTVMKNLELEYEGVRTEIDALVITKEAAIILEVKNTAKNIFIDEAGNYFRTGKYLRLDCELGAKLQLREDFIREALSETEYKDIPVKKIVVFTNNRIEVQNKCDDIMTCFVSQLPAIIDELGKGWTYSNDDIIAIQEILIAAKAEPKGNYLKNFDINEFRHDFAVLMAKLEEDVKECSDEHVVQENQEEDKQVDMWTKILPVAKYATAVVAGVLGTMAVANQISKRR